MKRREAYKPPVFIGQNIYVKPSYIVSIPEFYKEGGNLRSYDFLANQANLTENDHKGKLSRKAITGLKNSINWLCIAARKKFVYDRKKDRTFSFKVNFVTLTLPDTKSPISSGDFQKQLLNPFLTYMRKYQGLKNYVWRLEFQANGKLHVHLTSDTFLHLQQIRDTWNGLLDKNGHLDLFFKKNGHRNPNSTDVHATKKIKNLAAYLAKYMSKKGSIYKISKKRKVKPLTAHAPKAWYFQRLNFWNSPFNPRPITGRIWSCNTEISNANKLVVHIPSDECSADLKCLMRPDIEFREIMTKPKKTASSEFYPDAPENQPQKIGELYFLTAKDWLYKMNGTIKKVFDETRDTLMNLVKTQTFELI